ncbi:hypothetical protein ACI8AF_15855 [Blastococcus sp. SYSU D00669]
MALPGPDVVPKWVGRTVVDQDGAELGVCRALLTDDATGLPEWLYAEVGEATVVVPLVDATEDGDRVRVAFSGNVVREAPPPTGDTEHLSAGEEAALYRHYGIEYSEEVSETLLPADEPADEPTGEPAGGPAGPGGARRGGAVAAALAGLAGLAGLAALVAVVLRLRRRPRPSAGRPDVRALALPVATALGRAAGATGRGAVTAAASAVALGQVLGTATLPLLSATGRLLARGAGAGAAGVAQAAGATTRLAGAVAPVVAARAAAVGHAGVDAVQRLGRTVDVVPEAVAETGERLQKGGRKLTRQVSLGLGLGTGYVLGARAGRERFEQIKQAAVGLAERPEVQQVLGRVGRGPRPAAGATTVDVVGGPPLADDGIAVVTPVEPLLPPDPLDGPPGTPPGS